MAVMAVTALPHVLTFGYTFASQPGKWQIGIYRP